MYLCLLIRQRCNRLHLQEPHKSQISLLCLSYCSRVLLIFRFLYAFPLQVLTLWLHKPKPQRVKEHWEYRCYRTESLNILSKVWIIRIIRPVKHIPLWLCYFAYLIFGICYFLLCLFKFIISLGLWLVVLFPTVIKLLSAAYFLLLKFGLSVVILFLRCRKFGFSLWYLSLSLCFLLSSCACPSASCCSALWIWASA